MASASSSRRAIGSAARRITGTRHAHSLHRTAATSLLDVFPPGFVSPDTAKAAPWPTVLKPSKSLAARTSISPSHDKLPATLHRTAHEDNRFFLIKRLIDDARVISAMTAFFADIEAGRKPFDSEQFEVLFISLRRLLVRSPDKRPRKVSRHAKEATPLWRPDEMPTGADPRSLPLTSQVLLAMAELWNASIDCGITPSNRSISAVISTFSDYLPPDNTLQAARLALETFQMRVADKSPEGQMRELNDGVINTLIIAFGRAGSPGKGEEMLHQWASARAPPSAAPSSSQDARVSPSLRELERLVQRTEGKREARCTPTELPDICLAAWTHNINMWHVLIDGRVAAGDSAGAEAWLRAYRLVANAPKDICDTLGIRKPANLSSQAYLSVLKGHLIDGSNEAAGRETHRKMMSVVQEMQSDGVEMEDSIISFIARYLIRVHKEPQAIGLLERNVQRLQLQPGSANYPCVDLFATLFALFKYSGRKKLLKTEQGQRQSLDGVASLRAVISRFIDAGNWKEQGRLVGAWRYRKTYLINAAIEACIYQRDFPAAMVMLNTFLSWNLELDAKTHANVSQAVMAACPSAFFKHMRTDLQPKFLRNNRPRRFDTSAQEMSVDETMQFFGDEGGRWVQKGRLPQLRQTLAANAEGNPDSNGRDTLLATSITLEPRPLRDFSHLRRMLKAATVTRVEDVEGQSSDEPSTPSSWEHVVLAAVGPSYRAADRPARIVIEALKAAKEDILGAWVTALPPPWSADASPTTLPQEASSGARSLDNAPARSDAQSASSVRPSHRPKVFAPVIKVRLPRRGYATACSGSSEPSSPLEHAHLPPIRVEHIPQQIPYSLGLALQEHLVARRAAARAMVRSAPSPSPSASQIEESAAVKDARRVAATDSLLLLEHKPVYTEGRREGKEDEAVATALRKLGADYHVTKRGGQITYHGPGQLVGYPILDIGAMGLSTRCYVDRMQEALKYVLSKRYQLSTVPPPEDHTGVWADEYHKIASIGIQVRHRITSHGFGLNVDARSMRGFQYIVACGIKGRSMTHIEQELGKQRGLDVEARKTDMFDAVANVIEGFGNKFGRTMRRTQEGEFRYEFGEEDEVARALAGLGIEKREGERFVKRIWADGEEVVQLSPPS